MAGRGSVDAVVCARNERHTIRLVVRTLRRSPGIARVIVVDDRSSDGTGRKARLAGAKVVRGPGLGKGEAMTAGLAHVTAERVLFADADIRGLTVGHVTRLTSRPGMTVGLRDNGSVWLGPWPPVSGERCLPAWLARQTPLRGYWAETQLNAAAGCFGLPVRTVRLRGLRNPRRNPLARTVQVFRAAVRHVVGLAQYMAAWLVTAAGALLWG